MNAIDMIVRCALGQNRPLAGMEPLPSCLRCGWECRRGENECASCRIIRLNEEAERRWAARA